MNKQIGRQGGLSGPAASQISRTLAAGRTWAIVSVLGAGLFPSEALSLVGALAHIVIGWIEIGLKSLLEGLFGLSHRAAQVVVAWTGLGLMIVAVIVWVRRLWGFAKRVSAFLQTIAAMAMTTFSLSYVPPTARALGYALAGFTIAVYGML